MAYKDLEPVSKQLTIAVGLTVVGFMAFGLILSYYRNVLFDKTLIDMKGQNNDLRASIEEGYRSLEYFKSSQYKDKYAKENLGLVNPGEKVLIIQKPSVPIGTNSEISEMQKEQREAAFLELLRQMPTLEHWKLYFFGKEKLAGLKHGT
ncbi:MAG: hypothetical protein QF755_01115 [Candidatus Peribacteraceae bacterium]|jgi:cell division protein FtsB|nr:hypothetical protein [Candidatus Peribacteraceae bacterium]HCI03716.1 hypothetical protein [Candidatus Peribacteria bacterium]|tara:strand:+ start:4646 stop:5092 length:447 start_codon:yes stop_codon:yes gene_type:complete